MPRNHTWIIHPVIFSVYPVLFFYSQNIGQVGFGSVIKPLSITLASAILVWMILRLVLKNWNRAGFLVSFGILLFFSYGHAKNNIDASIGIYLLPTAWILILLTGVFFVYKSRKAFINTTIILNAASLVMLALVFLDIGRYQLSSDRSVVNESYRGELAANYESADSDSLPDIYFIILDAYAREDVLRDIYGFDNSEFLDFLKKKGFYVADNAIANYGQTGLSLGSSLNLEYLGNWVQRIGRENQSRAPLNNLIQNSRAISFLKKKGYQIVAFASTRPETDIKIADVFLNSGISVNEFHAGLRNSTPLPDISRPGRAEDIFTKFRRHTLFMFEELGKVASRYESPKFVFAHFELPHPPFVFGPNGESVQLETRFNDHDGNWLIRPGRLSAQQYREHYRDQVIFVNQQTRKVISKILETSKRPPIITILGDHGPRSRLVWESAQETDMRESMAILNAYYLPNKGDELLYPGISPVNTFRVIFNSYFGTKLELLPDRSYFSTARYLYRLQDVTDRVIDPENVQE